MLDYRVSEIIRRVRSYPSLPDTASRFTDQVVVDFINDEMYDNILPIIREAKEDFLVRSVDTTITTTSYDFDIPSRAAGASVYDVVVADPNDDNPNSYVKLQRIPFGERSVNYDGFLFNGSKITIINPDNHSGRVLRVFYVARPNLLVPNTQGAKITNIAGNLLTVDTDLTSVITVSDTVDIVQGGPHFDWRAIDQSISAITASTITLSSTLTNLEVNDVIALSEKSIIPQIPVEAHTLLAQSTVLKILEAIKDMKGYELAEIKFNKMLNKFFESISPRAELSPRKINSRNSFLTRRNVYY